MQEATYYSYDQTRKTKSIVILSESEVRGCNQNQKHTLCLGCKIKVPQTSPSDSCSIIIKVRHFIRVCDKMPNFDNVFYSILILLTYLFWLWWALLLIFISKDNCINGTELQSDAWITNHDSRNPRCSTEHIKALSLMARKMHRNLCSFLFMLFIAVLRETLFYMLINLCRWIAESHHSFTSNSKSNSKFTWHSRDKQKHKPRTLTQTLLFEWNEKKIHWFRMIHRYLLQSMLVLGYID